MQNEVMKRCYKSDLHYQVHYVSGTNVNGAYSAQLHYDTDLTVAYFKKAGGNIKIEGNSYELTSGDIVILNYNELHCVDIQSFMIICGFCTTPKISKSSHQAVPLLPVPADFLSILILQNIANSTIYTLMC